MNNPERNWKNASACWRRNGRVRFGGGGWQLGVQEFFSNYDPGMSRRTMGVGMLLQSSFLISCCAFSLVDSFIVNYSFQVSLLCRCRPPQSASGCHWQLLLLQTHWMASLMLGWKILLTPPSVLKAQSHKLSIDDSGIVVSGQSFQQM